MQIEYDEDCPVRFRFMFQDVAVHDRQIPQNLIAFREYVLMKALRCWIKWLESDPYPSQAHITRRYSIRRMANVILVSKYAMQNVVAHIPIDYVSGVIRIFSPETRRLLLDFEPTKEIVEFNESRH